MIKPISIIVLTILGTIFIIQNSSPVKLQVFVGNPIEARLISLLLLFYVIGYVWSTVNSLNRHRRLAREIKDLKIKLGAKQRTSKSVSK
ncbi:MAG: hypothetical protein HQK50_09785 [Oligoflexia bacterium]|nr:hypothetical protein [Oligoflexia bacterium]MBF0365853.1 hypothetical protein [Oligoflexia bacterium]